MHNGLWKPQPLYPSRLHTSPSSTSSTSDKRTSSLKTGVSSDQLNTLYAWSQTQRDIYYHCSSRFVIAMLWNSHRLTKNRNLTVWNYYLHRSWSAIVVARYRAQLTNELPQLSRVQGLTTRQQHEALMRRTTGNSNPGKHDWQKINTS